MKSIYMDGSLLDVIINRNDW